MYWSQSSQHVRPHGFAITITENLGARFPETLRSNLQATLLPWRKRGFGNHQTGAGGQLGTAGDPKFRAQGHLDVLGSVRNLGPMFTYLAVPLAPSTWVHHHSITPVRRLLGLASTAFCSSFSMASESALCGFSAIFPFLVRLHQRTPSSHRRRSSHRWRS